MPWLGSIGEAGFKKFTLLFFEVDRVTHSLFDDILMKCEVHGYRCRIVDTNVNRVLPREVAHAVMVPTTLVSRSGVRDVGKELALGWTHCICAFQDRRSLNTTGNFPSMHDRSGNT